MRLAALLLLAIAYVPAFPATGAPLFLPLGDLPGGGFDSIAAGMSAQGKVVVGTGYSDAGYEAYRWTKETGMVGLGYLHPSGYVSAATGVSRDGSIVVGWGDAASGTEAFRWTSEGGLVGLGDLPGGAPWSKAFGVSAEGSVVVGQSVSERGYEAFRLGSSGTMVGLGDLGGALRYSEGRGVSSDGSVVVGYSWTMGHEAFRWTAGGMVGLGDLPGGIAGSEAFGVSGDGSVVVGFGRPDNGLEAFRWTGTEGIVGLGVLPGRDPYRTRYSIAYGASEDGSRIVGSDMTGPTTDAFIWDAANGMQSVQNELIKRGIDLTDWFLFSAVAVSDDGLGRDDSVTIVGVGRNPSGYQEAWLAQIPEPGTGSLFACTLAGLAALRRRMTLSERAARDTSSARS